MTTPTTKGNRFLCRINWRLVLVIGGLCVPIGGAIYWWFLGSRYASRIVDREWIEWDPEKEKWGTIGFVLFPSGGYGRIYGGRMMSFNGTILPPTYTLRGDTLTVCYQKRYSDDPPKLVKYTIVDVAPATLTLLSHDDGNIYHYRLSTVSIRGK